jgi:alpha-L-fucosidase
VDDLRRRPRVGRRADLRARVQRRQRAKPFTADDVRFTTKDDALYAIVLGRPKDVVQIKALAHSDRSIVRIEQLGRGRSEVVAKR